MNVGSLFAGIGGFDLAFERAGATIAWQVEWDEACRRVLERRFDAPVFSDVRDSGAHNLPAVDVLCGGWPCQPVSVAGKCGASSDERDMWPEFARITSELRPTWVVGENVPGALSAEGGGYWRRVVDDLTQLGYGVVWRTLDAQHFGLAQRRKRVFVVGCLGDLERAAAVLLEPEGSPRHPAPSSQAGTEAAGPLGGGAYGTGRRTEDDPNLVVNALDQQAGGPDDNSAQAGHLVAGQGVRRLMPIECERLQGFPDGWTDVPGASDSVRYRQLGNAVAVPVVEWIAKQMSSVLVT